MLVFLILTIFAFGWTDQNVIREEEKNLEADCGSMDCPSGQRCELMSSDMDCAENCSLTAKCVPHQVKCGENQQIQKCGTPCEPSCDQPITTICTEQCLVDVCQCKSGFYRDKSTNKCVDQCANNKNMTDGSVSDEVHEKMCNEECGNSKNCYIQTSFDAKDNAIHKAICVKKPPKGKGIYFVETITPIPKFNPKLLIQPVFPKPRMICSIRCGPGKRCEIVDEPCFNSEPCPEIDVCVDAD